LAGALPQAPLGELTVLLQLDLRGLLLRKWRGEEGWGGDKTGGKEDPEHSPSSKFATTPVFRAHCKKTEIDIWKSWMPQWI